MPGPVSDFYKGPGGKSPLVPTWMEKDNRGAEVLFAQGSHRIEELRTTRDRLLAVLDRCADYFEERADAEYFPDSAMARGNEEMSILCEIREEMRRAK